MLAPELEKAPWEDDSIACDGCSKEATSRVVCRSCRAHVAFACAGCLEETREHLKDAIKTCRNCSKIGLGFAEFALVLPL